MMELKKINTALTNAGFGGAPGAYVLVDGQFGSTGKGLAASLLASLFHNKFNVVSTNAGPNSGHTSYYGDEKIVLRQLPTFSVIASKYGRSVHTQINAGAIIDIKVLEAEQEQYSSGGFDLWVHPLAAVADDATKGDEAEMVSRIGSTGKGTGAALANKIMRAEKATIGQRAGYDLLIGRVNILPSDKVFIEVSQGFSLGLNQRFYPYCTSRECTVGAAMSDAGIHPEFFRQAMMVVRTFPIRVAGNSGPCYEDQREITWGDLGQEPEYTTVTNKVRRVFTWSRQQYKEALTANRPDYIFLNFCNYLRPDELEGFVLNNIIRDYWSVMNRAPKAVLLGFGPKIEDVKLYEAGSW